MEAKSGKAQGNDKKSGNNPKSKGKNEKKSVTRQVLEFLRDIAIAALIVGIVLGILYAYSGVWPPPVVVESQSMSHDPPGTTDYLPPSQIGVIDGGDMVIVKKMDGRSQITTYIQGIKNGYQTYGSYGDVIIYKPPANVRYDQTPVIHRAVVWVEWNQNTLSWDVPDLGKESVTSLTIQDYGYNHQNVTIDLNGLTSYFSFHHKLPHSGYITMGDHNTPIYDQERTICPEPVSFEWVVGVARGELPWFGALKLWIGGNTAGVPENSWWCLAGAITAIIIIPIILDYIISTIRSNRRLQREQMKKDTDAGGGDAKNESGGAEKHDKGPESEPDAKDEKPAEKVPEDISTNKKDNEVTNGTSNGNHGDSPKKE
jgi:signal peptidase